MSGAAESSNNAAGAASKPRPTTPIPDSVAAAAAQRARHASNTSTPRRQRTNGKLTPITVLREEIAPQMDGEFMECSVERFIEHYLPFQPKDKDVQTFITSATYKPEPTAEAPVPEAADGVRATRATARAAPAPLQPRRSHQILESVDGKLRFIDYLDGIPTSSSETQSYSYLRGIMDAIGKATVVDHDRPRNRFQYRACPDIVVSSDIPGSDNRIDGCIISGDFISPNGDLNLKTTAIAVAFEFMLKSNKKLESDNSLQAVSANVQIMNDDVRRMFSYGVTIVEENVRLWYHGRSHSAVSEPFDFVENPAIFIKAMLAFFYATEAELGYDDKIRRLPDNRLVFEMEDGKGQPIYYRTVRTLSEYRSNNITGRMSRVWEVEEVSEPNETGNVLSHGVLKDVWLDDDALTERQVQNLIYEAVEDRKATIGSNKCTQGLDPTLRDYITSIIETGRYKEYFLSIVADCRGQASKAVAPGAKRKRGLLVPDTLPAKRSRSTFDVSRTNSYTPQPTQLERSNAARKAFIPREFRPKRQYRVVYAELCVTVGSMTTLGQVLDVLTQTLTALQVLYFAGWVHRDISSGNVMAYRTGGDDDAPVWQAKICDLEYAKQYSLNPKEASKDPKTGTPYFMPNEILFGKPLLPAQNSQPPTRAINQPLRNNDYLSQAAAAVKQTRAGSGVNRPTLVVIPNFQHDLESIWWLTIYTVTARVDHPPSNEFAREIFQHTTELCHSRAVFLEQPIGESLAQQLHPDLVGMAGILELIRERLLSHYVTRNEKRQSGATTEDLESYAGIHNDFYFLFKSMTELYTADPTLFNLNCRLIDEERQAIVAPPQPRKRARSVRNNDDDDYVQEEAKASEESEDDSDDEQPKKKRKPTGKSAAKAPSKKM